MIYETVRPRRIILTLILTGLLLSACASAEDSSKINQIIFSFEDPRMTAEDLAFYLVSHNYDAKPVGGYVELQESGKTYKLIPNGDKPGLCDLSPLE
jgi:hypothetical protein